MMKTVAKALASKGGLARAKKLSKKRRREIAIRAAMKRWHPDHHDPRYKKMKRGK